MHTLTLRRLTAGDAGTFGELVLPNGAKLATLELPWRDLDGDGDDDVGTSCVSAGTYDVAMVESPRFKRRLYRLNDAQTAPRKGVLIHTGNWGGDRKKGLRSSVEGCILVGKRTGVLDGQPAVLESAAALALLHNLLEARPFRLRIEPIKPGSNP